MVKICEVVDGCEDCPKYGDDCDGEEMTREEAILWLQVLKHSKINWVGEQAEDEDIIARCEEAEQEAFDIAIEALKDRPQGEWIEKYNGNGWNDFWDYTCSHCGKKYIRADYLYHANYCPNCGAKMKGGAE